MNITINLPNRPVDDEVEIVGLGLFKNGYVYEVDAEGEDRVYGKPLDSAPVKREDMGADSPEFKSLMRMTHEQLDALAEENKVTFDSDMTKKDKAMALLSVAPQQEGDS